MKQGSIYFDEAIKLSPTLGPTLHTRIMPERSVTADSGYCAGPDDMSKDEIDVCEEPAVLIPQTWYRVSSRGLNGGDGHFGMFVLDEVSSGGRWRLSKELFDDCKNQAFQEQLDHLVASGKTLSPSEAQDLRRSINAEIDASMEVESRVGKSVYSLPGLKNTMATEPGRLGVHTTDLDAALDHLFTLAGANLSSAAHTARCPWATVLVDPSMADAEKVVRDTLGEVHESSVFPIVVRPQFQSHWSDPLKPKGGKENTDTGATSATGDSSTSTSSDAQSPPVWALVGIDFGTQAEFVCRGGPGGGGELAHFSRITPRKWTFRSMKAVRLPERESEQDELSGK